MSQFWSSSYQQFCRVFFSLYCPVQVKGRENLPPPPYLLCSNHCSHMDTPVLMLSAGLPFRSFGMVVAKDYFFGTKNKQWLSWMMNLLPLDRVPNRKAMLAHIELCRHFCEEKKVIIFYPEGTRSLSGSLQKLKKGAAQYAYELQVPIVPVHIEGTFRSLPKGNRFPRPTKISVQIGKPLFVKEDGLPMLRQATQELETRISALQNN